MAANLDGVAEAIAAAQETPVSDVNWLPVIGNPEKILCVGLNYEMHRKETVRMEVGNPTIFCLILQSQPGQLQPIICPKVSTELNYEGELAVIISKPGRHFAG